MDQCYISFLAFTPPFLILNFITVTVGIIIGRYIDRSLYEPRYDSDSSEESSEESSSESEPKLSQITDDDLIASVRGSTVKASVESQPSELTNSLVVVVQKLTHLLGQNTNISIEKKQVFSDILKDIPTIINEPNNKEIETILKQKIAEITKLSEEQEREYLMKTLEDLQ